MIKAHESLLNQLLANLIDNAFKYSPVGSSVTIRLAVADGHAPLTVEDEGIGVDAEDIPHLFEPFYRGRIGASHG